MCNQVHPPLSTGLVDEQQKVRTITALALAALAEAATPYGIESFDSVLKPLWKGIRQHRGKVRSQSFKIKTKEIFLENLSLKMRKVVCFAVFFPSCFVQVNVTKKD